MSRYFLYLSYNGAQYCGWQIQPNGESVQEVVEKALTTLLRAPIAIVGAGRTDAGVHASKMTAHFDVETTISDTDELIRRLNGILPRDIAALDLKEVTSEAHARFDAMARTYKYYITTQKDPFLHTLKYKIFGDLDIDKMNACCKVLFEYQDFTSFSKLHTDVKTNDCTILQAEWMREGGDLIFTVKANRFLRNMVRAIVGTMLETGRGKLDEAGLRQVLEMKDRGKAGVSVPAHALFLVDVDYPVAIFK